MPRIRLALVPALVAGLMACSGDDGTVPDPVIARVVVTPDASSVTVLGATSQFEAQAQTSSGVPVTGVDFTWSSSNSSVATVDAAGRATAVAFGEATITATVDGVSAGAVFSVRDCSEEVALAPGQWTSLAVPAAGDCGVILPAGSAGDRYRVAVVRTLSNPLNTAVEDVSVEVVPLGGASAPAATFTAAAATSESDHRRPFPVPGLAEAARIAERTAQMHQDLRLREADLVRRLGTEALLRESSLARSAPAAVDLPQTIQIDPTTPSSCSPAGTKVTAQLIWQDDRLAFYQDADQAQTELAVTAAQVQRMAEFYEQYGEPIIETYFDGISDIDGNGKVIVFISPVVTSGTAAFVWSGDFFSASGTNGCPASNEGEYVYFSASLIQAQDNPDNPNWQSLETLVHEMKHVSSLYNSVERPLTIANPYHPSWEEEGSAEIAGNMASRLAWSMAGGPAPNARVDEDDIADNGFDASTGSIKPEFYGVALRMLRTQGFLSSQPNGVVVTPVGADDSHSVYGSGWTFLRWLGDAYGDAASSVFADADLFTQLNSSDTEPGILGLEAVTGTSFPRLMEEFAAAAMLHGTSAPQGDLSFTSYDFVTAVEIFCFAADNPPCTGSSPGPTGVWPWPVTVNSDGTPSRSLQQSGNFAGRIGPGGLRIHDFVSGGTGIGAELVISAPVQSRIVVVRIQ